MQGNKENLIVELTFQFALKIIKQVESLEQQHRYVIGRQLLKAGTSIGASVREAQNAESKPDFIHKMKIAAKEADETEYWLLLCKQSFEDTNDDQLLNDCGSILKVLSKIISTSKGCSKFPNFQISKSPN
jgi:four helix bundle protein